MKSTACDGSRRRCLANGSADLRSSRPMIGLRKLTHGWRFWSERLFRRFARTHPSRTKPKLPALAILERAICSDADLSPNACVSFGGPRPAFAQVGLLRFWSDPFRALLQRVPQVDRHAVFLEKIGKGFVDQFLKRGHSAAAQVGELHQSGVNKLISACSVD